MANQQPEMAPGQKYLKDLEGYGFTQEEIEHERAQQSEDMVNNGFAQSEVANYWGQKDPDMSPVKDIIKNNLAKSAPQEAAPPAAQNQPSPETTKAIHPETMWELIKSGWQHSVPGLIEEGKVPEYEVDEKNSMLQATVANSVTMLADLPVASVGAMLGGRVAGKPGFWFGMGALPAGMRKFIMDKYQKGEIQDSGDAARRVVDASWAAFKGGAASMAMGAAGENIAVLRALGGGQGGLLTKALSSVPSQIVAENAAQTAVSSALEGHLPSAREFAEGTVAMAGFHAVTSGFAGAKSVKGKLQDIWANTGARPAEVAEAVNQDPALRGELMSDNPDLPKEAKSQPLEELTQKPKEEPPPKAIPDQEVKEGYELPEEERNHVLSLIGEEPKLEKETVYQKAKDAALDIYVNTFDKASRIKELLDMVSEDKELDDKNSYVLARAFGDINGKVESVIKKGTIDPFSETNEVNGESLDKIDSDYLKETGDKSFSNIKAYMMSSRISALAERGLEQPGDLAKHQSLVEAGKEKYEAYAQRYSDFQNRNLNYAYGKGLLSKEQYTKMVDEVTYIPLHKVVEADNITGRSGSSSSLKKIGSSILQIKDPFDAIRKNTEVLIRAADRNAILRQAAKDLSGSDFMEDVTPGSKAIDVSNQELSSALKSQGIDVHPDAIDGFSVFRKASAPDRGNGVFLFRDEGKLKAIKTDPGLADVLNSYMENPQGMGLFTRAFRTAAASLRAGTIQNPLTGFWFRHPIRSEQLALINTQTGMYGLDIAKAILEPKDQELWDKAVRNGALISEMGNIPKEYYTDLIQRQDKQFPFIDQAWNKIDNTLAFSHAVIMANDNRLRFEEYKRTLDQGGSEGESVMNARDLLPDFQKNGLKQGFLQSTVGFFKAHYLGEFQMVEKLANSDASVRKSALARYIGFVTVPSILIGMAQADDERVQNLPDWLKWNYWNLHLPNWRDADYNEAMSQKSAYPGEVRQKPDGSWQVNDGYIFRIPKPFTGGVFFGNVHEEAYRAMYKQDPKLFAKFLTHVAEGFVANPVPTMLEPVLEQATNRNFFNSRPLIRSELERNHVPEMQYTPYTSETAKWLGNKISYVPLIRDIGPGDAKLASPPVIENYVNAYTGGSGKYILQTTDRLMGFKGGPQAQLEDMKALKWQDVPLVKEFLVRHDLEPQSVTDFMDTQDLAQKVQGSIRDLKKQGDYAKLVEIQDKYATDGIKVGKYKEMIINMMQQVHKLDRCNMDPVQKRQLSDGYNYQIISAAKAGQEVLDSLKDVVKKEKGN